LFREAVESSKNEDPHILHAQPLEDNLFEWHFTFKGPPDTVYGQGIYHGRVIFPSKYPMSPPEIVILTVRQKQII
jgi:ubiquitin-conjugating enzyme E2 J1